jgi:hypothetical protein
MTTRSNDPHVRAIVTLFQRLGDRCFGLNYGSFRSSVTGKIGFLLLAGLIVALPIAPAPDSAGAVQETSATPGSEPNLATQLGLNEGVTLLQLASGTAESVPSAPLVLRLEEVGVDPGQSDVVSETRGPELIYIESGSLTAVDSIGFRAVLTGGQQVLFNVGFGYTLVNESGEAASFLRLAVRPLSSDMEAATPSPAPDATSTANALILFQSHLDAVPSGPAVLFLGHMSWDPQAESGQYWHDGVLGMMLETGELTVHSPSGLDVHLMNGAAELLPPDQAHNDFNPGSTTAEVLVFAFVSADDALLRSGAPDESATPTP